MVRSVKSALTLTLLLSSLVHLQAGGQTIPSSYNFFETRQEAGVFAGVTNQGTGRFGYGPQPGTILGARYSIHLGGPFGLEGVLGYLPTSRDIVDPSRDEGDRVVGEADVNLLSFDVRLRFSLTGDRTWKGIHPFVLLGIGLGSDLAGASPQDELLLQDDRFELGTRLVAVFGGGARWFLTDRIMARGDIFVNMYQLKAPRGFLDPGRGLTGVGEKEWVSGPTYSLGLAYHF
ncbi:MAG: hypothetical protein KJN92_00440 [Gemmatimonadetes bacterium]|nr:hypothetical protein [Gemmatimonadota bacterium]